MDKLVVLGTTVHAFEMVELIERINHSVPTWDLLGFISEDEGNIGQSYNGYQVIGTKDILGEFSDVFQIPAYGWPYKSEIPDERLVSLIDPSSFVSHTARIGAGTVIFPNCFIGHNVRIGKMVFCLSGCIINHDDILEDGVVLASGVSLAGTVHVEADCYLGQSCTFKQSLKIGRGSFIGMGSVVIRDVLPNSVMVGNPAKRLRDNR